MAAFDRNLSWQRFYALVDSIPKGRVATYGQIAREAGMPRHARHVGHALRALPLKSDLPWHRVINSQGVIPDRGGSSLRVHRSRLRKDGVEVSAKGKVDLRRYQWEPNW